MFEPVPPAEHGRFTHRFGWSGRPWRPEPAEDGWPISGIADRLSGDR